MQIKGDQQLHTFLPTILALMHYCNNHTSCNNTHGDVYSKWFFDFSFMILDYDICHESTTTSLTISELERYGRSAIV